MMENRDRDRERRGWSLSQISVLGVLFSVALFVGNSCGKKGDPRAPGLSEPETITDLRGEIGRGGIVLTWSRPTHSMDGKRLRDLAGFVIFRKEISSACPECPVPYRERATILVEDLESSSRSGSFALWTES